MAYDAEKFVERRLTDVAEVQKFLADWPVTWINVDGVGDASVVAELGRCFGLHKLALEDVVHVHQRAKTEVYADHFFVVARMPISYTASDTEQISLFFGDRFVLTFQEHPGGDCLNPVRARIRSGWGRSRAVRSDYLVYTLLDTIVDHYFPVVEQCGERLDELEAEIMSCSALRGISRLHSIKRDLVSVRRVIWPMREAVSSLLRESTPLVSDETRIFLRDVQDHTIQILDLVEAHRDIAAGITEVYLSQVSQRTNEIMKVLTIITTIFIPLSFIAGLYGMNFNPQSSPWNMPELEWYWGYPVVLSVMAALVLVMLFAFHRRGWLGRDRSMEISDSEGSRSK